MPNTNGYGGVAPAFVHIVLKHNWIGHVHVRNAASGGPLVPWTPVNGVAEAENSGEVVAGGLGAVVSDNNVTFNFANVDQDNDQEIRQSNFQFQGDNFNLVFESGDGDATNTNIPVQLSDQDQTGSQSASNTSTIDQANQP